MLVPKSGSRADAFDGLACSRSVRRVVVAVKDHQEGPPHVTAIVPVLNDADTLDAAVASIFEQEYEGCLSIVIAVGPSKDGSARVARALAQRDDRVRLVENPSGGTASGLNRAIAAAEGEVIARVDAHAKLAPDYIRLAVALLQRTGAANVGGMQVAVGRDAFERAIAAAMASPFGSGDSRFRVGGPAGPTDSVYLGVFRRDVLDRVGGFDERLVRNQDYELNIRIRESGGVVYFDPALRVEYRPRASLVALAGQYFGYGCWKAAVVELHPRSLRPRQVVPPIASLANVGALGAALLGKRWAYAVPLIYLLATLAAAVRAGRSASWAVRRRLPIVFATMHHAWGAGFVVGACRIALRRRRPNDERSLQAR